MQTKREDAEIIFGKQCLSIGLYNRKQHAIADAYSLFQPESDPPYYCKVTVWLSETDLSVINMKHTAAATTTYDHRIIDFTTAYGDIWLDDTFLIIGVGDLRDGYADTLVYNLATLKQDELIIEGTSSNKITIHSSQEPYKGRLYFVPNNC